MNDRDQQLIEAAMEYLTLFESEALPNMDDFVAKLELDLQAELKAYLLDVLESDISLEPPALSEEEQRLAEEIRTRERERFLALPQGDAVPVPTLTEVRLQQRLSLGRLARRLHLPVAVLDRLERGGIALNSLPDHLWELLGETLNQTRAGAQAIMAASQMAASSRLQEGQAGYLSARDGTTIQPDEAIAFGEAFMSSAPSAEQQAYWEPHLGR